MDNTSILGIKISLIRKNAIRDKLEDLLIHGRGDLIVTPNPEILLAASNDEDLFNILNSATLAVADGIGLKFAGLALGTWIERITGVDLVEIALKAAHQLGKKVGVLVWEDGLTPSETAKNAIKSQYPGLKLEAWASGRKLDEKVIESIASYSPDLVIIGLGSPWQEKAGHEIASRIRSARLVIPCGATIDYLAGTLRRAPKIMRYFGLEWLWRLAVNMAKSSNKSQGTIIFPRNKRIFNALAVFPIKFLEWAFINPFFYRNNIACLVFKKIEQDIFVIIVERKQEPGHWQLPQGGVDNLELESAARKEIREELNIKKIETIAVFSYMYKYKFKSKDISKDRGYRGQRQALYIGRYSGNDSEIRINPLEHNGWKWVSLDQLIERLHPARRESARIYVKELMRILGA